MNSRIITRKKEYHSSKEYDINSSSSRKSRTTLPFSSSVGGTHGVGGRVGEQVFGSNEGNGAGGVIGAGVVDVTECSGREDDWSPASATAEVSPERMRTNES